VTRRSVAEGDPADDDDGGAMVPPFADLEADAGAEAGALFAALVVDYFAGTRVGAGPVSTPRDHEALAARFDEVLPRSGRPLAEVVARLARDVVADSNRLAHPMAMGHQVSAPLPAAVWTEALTAALNQSGAVWEMSPVGTVIEERVIRWMCDLVGWGAASGGTFTSGGTEATFAALLAARSAALPEVWTRGLPADRAMPVVVVGAQAHYAVARAIGEMGLGLDRAIVVPTSDDVMDVTALERALARLRDEGVPVLAVVATAGSTPTGAFDDLEAIGSLCEARGLWMHVDAAHGGSALLSRRHAARLRGLHRARSIAWDPHKMMLLPLSAGVVLMRDERALEAAFAQQAPYLFHGADGDARDRDQGIRTFPCSRRIDALKVWVALQRYGADGIGALYDHLCDATRTLYGALGARREFACLHAPASNILCFRYVGDGALGEETLDELNREMRERYNRSGDGWITSTVLRGRRVLRVTIMNPRTTVGHVTRLVDGLAALGARLAGATSPS
jgi:glutamate/tyrosine decarboxylase-like PLP-dependent enzyme